MKTKIKLWAHRVLLRWLRKLIDAADDRLHAAEMSFRLHAAERREITEIQPIIPYRPETAGGPRPTTEHRVSAGKRQPETFEQWEKRRSGIAPISKKEARTRKARAGARAFDLRFAR